MDRSRRVYVTVVGKNEQKHVAEAIKSIFDQTYPIAGIIFVDDGSTDNTIKEVKRAFIFSSVDKGEFTYLHIIRRPNRINGPNLVGQPTMAELVNVGLDYITTNHSDYDFILNMNSSISLPNDYVWKLIEKFDSDDDLVIASGGLYIDGKQVNARNPSGAGRMIKRDYFKWYGERFPKYYGWESEIFLTAMRVGLKIAAFSDVPFYSLKGKRQNRLNYIHWGRGMNALGYSFPSTIFRGIMLTILRKNIKVLVQLLSGYFSGYASYNDLNEWEIERTNKTRNWYRSYEIIHKVKKSFTLIGAYL